jgi:hypothetical protein
MITLTDKMAFKLPDFMASSESRKRDSQRPQPLHVSKSFSKLEPASPDRSTRVQRASTIQNGVNPEGAMSDKSQQAQGSPRRPTDTFEKSSEDEEDQGQTGEVSEKLPPDFDELPIELVSLTDRSVWKIPNVLQVLKHSQLHRLLICQNPSYPTNSRQTVYTISRLLYSCCYTYQYTYFGIVLSPASRKLTGTLGILTLIYSE